MQTGLYPCLRMFDSLLFLLSLCLFVILRHFVDFRLLRYNIWIYITLFPRSF
jgi:hypothetical protein